MKYFVTFLLIALSVPAHSSDTWVHVYGVSWHDRPGYRETNTGLGVERQLSPKWSAMAGTFQNSLDRQSVIVAAKYHWIRQGAWSVNWHLGGVTGYPNYTVAPMLLPEVCWHWICAMAVPAVGSDTLAAAAFYLRIPLP